MKIRSYVGGHEVVVIAGAHYDAASRKYRGGTVVARIPFGGRMLSAHSTQPELPDLPYEGASLPRRSAPQWESVDPLPSPEECDYAIVSTQYVAACHALGQDTSRLLTSGPAVVDDDGRLIGTAWLTQN